MIGIINSAGSLPDTMNEYRNPVPTVDVILQHESKVLMIRRKKETFQGRLALPGGFINEGETAEEAVKRETMEETSLQVEPTEILGVYSDPSRDPRGHIMTVVFVGIIVDGSKKAGDDAKEIEWLDLDRIDGTEVAFDHMQILRDYRQWRASGGTFWSTRMRNY